MDLEIRLAKEPDQPAGTDLEGDFGSLLELLRARFKVTHVVPLPDADAGDDAAREPAVRVAGLTAETARSLASLLSGWLGARPGAAARLVLTSSRGRKLEVPGADWGTPGSATALARFTEAEVRADELAHLLRGRNAGAGSAPPPPGSVRGRPRGDKRKRPDQRPSPGTDASTPPGPPFGDEDDDEW